MTQPEEALTPGEAFDLNRPQYDRLLIEVLFGLEAVTKAKGIKTHTITGRVKDRGSFLEKIERKISSKPFVDIHDIVGARVVCLFLSDLPKVSEAIHSIFEALEEEDKVESGDPRSFGYMSIHYVCRLGTKHSGPRYDGLNDLVFEVQCRTIVMDAWANVSHYLAYKGNASVPEELRKDFYALSGLFYVADHHFELFFGEATGSRQKAVEQVSRSGVRSDISIDLDTLSAYLHKKYPDRKHIDAESVSDLIEEISSHSRYKTICRIRRSIDCRS